MMAIACKILPLFFAAALAGPYCRWLIGAVDKPLWGDELITVALVKSASFSHLLAAVLFGLEPTPPLYEGYGWFILHFILPGASPALLLRLTNAVLIAATLWMLYLSTRQFLGQMTALTAIAVFILLEMWPLKFLLLEVRTYSSLIFFTALAVYAALRALACPSRARLTCAMVAYCFLAGSHIFGIIYVLSIASCAMAGAAIEGNLRLALTSGIATAPATVLFGLWVPVLHQQAQLGSWISRPNLEELLWSIFPLADRPSVLAMLMPVAVLILLWRGYRLRRVSTDARWWRRPGRAQIFVVALPIAFYGSTFAVWLFSQFVFTVFIERYFYPNILLHIIWISLVTDLVFRHLILTTTKCWLALGSAVLAGLCIKHWQFAPDERIDCFDASRGAYIEDPFIADGPIVALWIQPWLTRLHRPGERVVFPIDEGALKKNGINHERYLYYDRWVRRYAEWARVDALMTTSQLLASKPGFLVLDDAKGPWLAYIQREHRVKLTPLAEMKRCILWRVQSLE